MNKKHFTLTSVILAAGLILTGCSSVSTDAPKDTKPVATKEAPVTTVTVSQQQALNKAKSYLEFKAFSQLGLVKQLKYDEFAEADAQYAAAHVGANWNDQAARAAKEYLAVTAFSRDALIKQLKYDSYTQAQAEHGADAVGLN